MSESQLQCDLNYYNFYIYLCSFEVIQSSAKAGYTLMNSLDMKLLGSTKPYMTSLKSAVLLMLYILDKVQKFQESHESTEQTTKLQKDIVNKLQWLLKNWIVRSSVIGGSFFGYSVSRYTTTKLSKEQEELKVFNQTSICYIFKRVIL